jgi:hypothetical protein
MEPLQCAPIVQNGKLTGGNTKKNKSNKKVLLKSKSKKLKHQAFNGTCYSREDLLRLVREWNILNHHNRIPTPTDKTDSQQIWNALKEKMQGSCTTEYCWLEQLEKTSGKTKKSITELKENFRPEMPDEWHKKHTEWLSSLDIEKVLEQYDDEFPEFKFMGAVPIDFNKRITDSGQCVSNNMCNFNIRKLKKQGKTKIGIVFNLDEHNKSGSHWIAMYLDLSRRDLGYWDSYAYQPPQEVKDFIERVQNQARKYWKCQFREYINTTRHQYKNSECGMYCINFIVQLLEGQSYNDVFQNIIKDDDMNSYRANYFNKDF